MLKIHINSDFECNICYRDDVKVNDCQNIQCTFKICNDCSDIYYNNYNYKKCPQCKTVRVNEIKEDKYLYIKRIGVIIIYLITYLITSYFIGCSITKRYELSMFIYFNIFIGAITLSFILLFFFIIYILFIKYD